MVRLSVESLSMRILKSKIAFGFGAQGKTRGEALPTVRHSGHILNNN